ncbi:hypothetical protein LAD77_00360 [Klebsiella pneumoniae]|nr:hypothetical protein [Klebsiella pneumoniae]
MRAVTKAVDEAELAAIVAKTDVPVVADGQRSLVISVSMPAKGAMPQEMTRAGVSLGQFLAGRQAAAGRD